MTLERVCSVQDVPDGEVRRFDFGSVRIALAHIGGAFYAIGFAMMDGTVKLHSHIAPYRDYFTIDHQAGPDRDTALGHALPGGG